MSLNLGLNLCLNLNLAEFMVFVEFTLEFIALCEFAFVSSTPLTRGFKFVSRLLEKPVLKLKFIIQNPLCIKC